jgi:Na+-driven multidrug efflux pump
MFHSTLLITLSLALTIALHQLRVLLAVLFLVVAMFVPPLLLAVADDLEILRVCSQLLPVIIAAPPALAFQPTAHALLRTINGRYKRTLAVRTTAGLAQADSSGIME